MSERPRLNLTLLIEALSSEFQRKVHPAWVRRRIPEGLPCHIERASGRRYYYLDEVLPWLFPYRDLQ